MPHLITCELTEPTAAARGRQHGQALGEGIATLYDNYVRLALMIDPGSEDERAALKTAMGFWPAMEAWAPELCDEMTGISEGAGLPLEHVVLLNLYDEIGLANEHNAVAHGCSGFAVHASATSDGNHYIGQNLDICRWYLPCVLFTYAESDGETEKIMISQPGIVGGPGMNRHIAMCWLTTIPRDSRVGVPGPFLIRRGLQERDAEAALDVIASAPRAMGQNFIIGDSDRLLNYEGTAERYVRADVADVFGHANHYLAPSQVELDLLEEADAVFYASSCNRSDRIRELLAEHSSRIDHQRLRNILADHHGHPFGICEHEEGENFFETLVAMIFEPGEGRLSYTAGTPCDTPWESVEMSGAVTASS